MSNFGGSLHPQVVERVSRWPHEEQVRLYKFLESLCKDPEAGLLDEDENFGSSYEDTNAQPRLRVTYRLNRKLHHVEVLFADFTTTPRARELQVFLSYSQRDRKWFKRLRRALRLIGNPYVRFWCDRDIPSGQRWYDLIQDKISDASAALLLVSEDFLRSEFIREYELPSFLDRAGKPSGRPFLLLWIPLARRETIKADDLGGKVLDYQALLNPKKPLNKLRRKKAEISLVKIALKVIDLIFQEAPEGAWH